MGETFKNLGGNFWGKLSPKYWDYFKTQNKYLIKSLTKYLQLCLYLPYLHYIHHIKNK